MKQANNKSKTPTAATIGASKSSVFTQGTNMKSLANSITNVTVTMSSREIAELTGKKHSHVIRDIWTMFEQLYDIKKDDPNLDFNDFKGFFVKREVINGREAVSEILLDRRHTEILITGYDVKRRAAVIDRWFALESEKAKPQAHQPAVSNIVLITDELGRYKLSVLHNASGGRKSKEPSKWLKTRHAKEWVADLSVVSGQDVIRVQKNQGTFAHEILAVEYAGWLSPLFQMQFKQAIGYDRTVIETNVVISVNRPLPKGIYLQNSKVNPYRAVIYSGSETISVGCFPTVEAAVDAQNRYFDSGEVKRAPFRLNADGQYLVTVTNGKVSKYESVGDKALVDAEAYWRLRKDINYTEQNLAELKNRMRFIHDERSIASIDYPIHEAISR